MSTPHDLSLEAYAYDLPPELIAQTPIEPRDSSRLMVVRRAERRFERRVFTDVLEYLRPGDVMVFNDSKVFPARMYGSLVRTGAKIELLLLRRQSRGVWHALARPGRRLLPGTSFVLRGDMVSVEGEVLEAHDDGSRTVRLNREDVLDEIGVVPLPPYIREPLEDPERYQTVYARERGSVAAPTAGLHVTPRLMEEIRRIGVHTAFVTLHVGWATFRPVQVEEIADHDMHAEFYRIDEESAETINRAKRKGRRVIAVGTTTVRLLEYAASLRGREAGDTISAGSGWADIFIYPGFSFRVINALVTNFHLPQSTLLMLVSAFADRELMLAAYREAVGERYRFYSFGDAMLIL